jgi:hypothetical protein
LVYLIVSSTAGITIEIFDGMRESLILYIILSSTFRTIVHIMRLFVSSEVISKNYPDYRAPIEVKCPSNSEIKKTDNELKRNFIRRSLSTSVLKLTRDLEILISVLKNA